MNRKTCEGCPISENHITTDALCTDYCSKVENWLQVHDAEVRAKAIDEVFDFLKTKRDRRYMKVGLDDLEIRQYKGQLKEGGK